MNLSAAFNPKSKAYKNKQRKTHVFLYLLDFRDLSDIPESKSFLYNKVKAITPIKKFLYVQAPFRFFYRYILSPTLKAELNWCIQEFPIGI